MIKQAMHRSVPGRAVCGLYAVTPDEPDTALLAAKVRSAIGGIAAANAPQLLAAGADCVAVISALFSASDVEASARQFVRLFPPER